MSPAADPIGDIKLEIDLTRARISETLRAIDGRAHTQLQRLHRLPVSPTALAAAAAGAIAVVVTVARIRRRRYQGGNVR